VGHVAVGAHVGRVLAAEFEPHGDERAGGIPLHRLAAFHRAGEAHHVGEPRRDDLARLAMIEHQVLEAAFGQPRLVEGSLKALGHQQRLGGVLEHHGVAGHERGNDRVDRGHVGEVPRGDREHDAQRLARDGALEARLRSRIDGLERLFGDPIMCRARSSKPFISPAPKRTGRPICQASSGTISSVMASMASTAARQYFARSATGSRDHSPCAARALRKVSAMAFPLATGRSANTEPSTGDMHLITSDMGFSLALWKRHASEGWHPLGQCNVLRRKGPQPALG
jgi:hypothetical protein